MSSFLNVLTIALYVGVVPWHLHGVNGDRILAISPISAKSHWNFMKGILRALTDHGHHVTVFTSFPDYNRENYTVVDVSNEIETLLRFDMREVRARLHGYTDLINFVHHYSRDTFTTIFGTDEIRAIVADPKPNFDVVIIEYMASEWVSYLAGVLNLPLIYVTPAPLISYGEHLILGHYANPALVSHTLADHSVPRTFAQRFTNTALLIYTSCLLRYKSWFAGKYEPRRPFDLVEPVKPSIVFSNSHYVTDVSRSLPPNVIQIGGIHLDPPEKIPQDVLEFIENSPSGVILFTLGSIVTISSLPKHTKEAIIEVLGRIPQRVLLKYEDNITIDMPKNVMTKKWFSQRTILLHPNVKLFISHGGISGVYEAVDAGIPVLGFPVFFDQHRNLANLVDADMAISMNLESINKDTFMKAVTDLINNEKYTKNAKITRELFKDRPMSPAQTVDYWTRYVVRHKGAHHLKSQAHNLTWYQYFLLDVIAVTLLALFLVVYVTRKTISALCNYCIFTVTSNRKLKSQ